MSTSRKFILGFDLGTTNSVLAYAPLDAETSRHDQPTVEILRCRSSWPRARSSRGRCCLRSRTWRIRTRPRAARWTCRGPRYAITPWANTRGGKGPKCQTAPWARPSRGWPIAASIAISRSCRGAAPESVDKISPVATSQRYLEHIVAAWEQAHPESPVAEQIVVLTVPASFDAVARELTREAALAAGLPHDLVLLEEPQAAVYAWLADRGQQWRKALKLGDTLLVCDVGGGTTDLTLVTVAEEGGELVLRRMAVGNHLLVGGDNMDLALAHFVAGRFAEKGTKLDPWQSVALWHSCRNAKETLLAGRRHIGKGQIPDLGPRPRQPLDRRHGHYGSRSRGRRRSCWSMVSSRTAS